MNRHTPSFRGAPAPSPARALRLAKLKPKLDALYDRFNHVRMAEIDPIRFVIPFDDTADREVAGLVAALLAYGGIKTILRNVHTFRAASALRLTRRRSPDFAAAAEATAALAVLCPEDPVRYDFALAHGEAEEGMRDET